MDPALLAAQRHPGPHPVPGADDLGKDRQRYLSGLLGSDVDSDRGMDPFDLLLAPALRGQALGTHAGGAPAAHGADVANRCVSHRREYRPLEPGVMTQQHDIGAPIQLHLLEHRVRPALDQLVDVGKPLLGSPGGPGIGDNDAKPQLLSDTRQRLRHMAGAKDQELRLRRHGFDVDLAVAVGQCAVLLVLHELPGVGKHVIDHVSGEFSRHEALIDVDHRLRAQIGSGNHGDHRTKPLSLDQIPDRLDNRHHHFSM